MTMEVDPGSHTGVQQGFEDVVDLVEQPRVVDDVNGVRCQGETRLEKNWI